MRRFLAIALVAVGFISLGSTSVEARKIAIPCTGELIINVLDIPAMAGVKIGANRHMREKRLDLGYKFKYCFSGEWVGYIGSDTSYVPLDANKLKALVALAGLKEPPSEPSFLRAPDVQIMLLILAVFGTFGVWKLTRERSAEQAVQTSSTNFNAAIQAMDRAAAALQPASTPWQTGATTASAPAAPSSPANSTTRVVRQPRIASASPGFGRHAA